MPDQRSSIESEAHAYLDRGVLGLLLDIDKQRPWSEAEIAREISTPGHVPASLKRLRTAGLVHRWNDLVTASRSAVRFHEIPQSGDPASAEERHHDKAVLESLLVRASDGQGPLSEEELWEAFSAKEQTQLDITDALNRLDAAGLIERRGGKAIASEVATYFDQIMTL
jgi:predicted transcriptional regulator